MQLGGAWRHAFDRCDAPAVRLHGEHQARAHRLAVQLHRARAAADACLTGASPPGLPLSRRPASSARTGRGPAESSEMAMSLQAPFLASAIETAAPPSAKSPCRRAYSTKATPVDGSRGGTSI